MSNDLHSLVDHISCDEVDLEIRLEEISKENSMLRSINEMILHEGACQKPTRRFEDPAPLKHRIKELELFLFNLGSENQVLQKNLQDSSRQLQLAKDRFRSECVSSQALRGKVESLQKKMEEYISLEDSLKSAEKKLASSRKATTLLQKEKEKLIQDNTCLRDAKAAKDGISKSHVFTQTRVGVLHVNTQTDSSTLDVMTQTEPSSLHVNIQTESSTLHMVTQTEESTLHVLAQTESSRLHMVTTQTELSTLHVLTQTEASALHMNIETEPCTLHVLTQTESLAFVPPKLMASLLAAVTCHECKANAQATLFPCGHGTCNYCFERKKQKDTKLIGPTCLECANNLPITRVCQNHIVMDIASLILSIGPTNTTM